MIDEYKKYIGKKDQLLKEDSGRFDADFGRSLGTKLLGMHWVVLPAHTKSTDPHAESLEEEFIYVVSGRPHLWLNGYIYQLEPGICVGFPAGTGIAHTFINNTSESVELVVLGDRTKDNNKCSFPINPELKNTHSQIWWDDFPPQEMGPHDAKIGNLQHQRNWQELSFVKQVYQKERKAGFSYQDDTEKFTLGLRLTDEVGLKSLGLWHEIMKPGHRSSCPHAHEIEEEAAILLKGKVKVWLNGFTYELTPGDCVFFKPGTGIAHCLINDSNENAEFIGIGQADDAGPEEKIYYPLHQTRNEQCIERGYFWSDAPTPKMGQDFGVPLAHDITFEVEKNAAIFLEKNNEHLYSREAEYSLMLGLTELKTKTESVDNYTYITILKNGNPIGAAVNTEKALIVTALQEPWILKLAQQIQKMGFSPLATVGPAHSSEFLARIWSKLNHQKYKLGMGQKIYKLDQVIFPEKVSGELKLAQVEHHSILADWISEFYKESLPHDKASPEKIIELAKNKIEKKEAYIWINSSGQPISMNLVGRPTTDGISVSGVYTPKSFRRRGFASALVAATSQQMLDQGKKFCVLYTDTSNPTSNKIYQQIGYKEIATSKYFVLGGE